MDFRPMNTPVVTAQVFQQPDAGSALNLRQVKRDLPATGPVGHQQALYLDVAEVFLIETTRSPMKAQYVLNST